MKMRKHEVTQERTGSVCWTVLSSLIPGGVRWTVRPPEPPLLSCYSLKLLLFLSDRSSRLFHTIKGGFLFS